MDKMEAETLSELTRNGLLAAPGAAGEIFASRTA